MTPDLKILLRDPDTDVIVVPDLFVADAKFTSRALLPGYTGSVQLGDFELELPPMGSAEFAAHKDQYDAILATPRQGRGLKVEAYLGAVTTLAGPLIIRDWSGNGNHAAPRLQAALGLTTGQTGLVSGDTDACMALGKRTGITCPSLAPLVGGATRSVEFWVSTGSTVDVVQPVLDGSNIVAAGREFMVFMTATGSVGGSPATNTPGLYLECGSSDVYLPTARLNDGAVHHVVITVSGTTCNIFYDATQPSGYIWNGIAWTALTAQPFTLPSSLNTPTNSLRLGYISHPERGLWGTVTFNLTAGYFLDEVAVYGTALSSGQVTAHKNAGAAYRAVVLADSPTAYYRLDETLPGTAGVVASGVVDEVDFPLGGGPWTLRGPDTLWWLQQSLMMDGESFGAPVDGALPTTTLEIVEALSCTPVAVWDDNFSNWSGGGTGPTSADYALSGFSFTSADPFDSLPALTSSSLADSYAVTVTQWSRLGEYGFSSVTATGWLRLGTPGVGNVADDFGLILFSDANFQNGILARVAFVQNAAGLYNVNADIFAKSGGSYGAAISSHSNVFTNVYSPFDFELTAIHTLDAGMSTLTLRLNGTDCQVAIGGLGNLFGAVGVRFIANAGGSPAVFINNLYFRGRTTPFGGVPFAWAPPRFAKGTWVDDGGSIPQQFTVDGQSQLDLLAMAAVLKGAYIRKRPGAGAWADKLDYGLSLGVDRSQQVVFREGDNVVAEGTTVRSASGVFTRDIRSNAVPGGNSGGSATRRQVLPIGSMALTGVNSDLGAFLFEFQRKYAEAVRQRRSSGLTATQVTVRWTADLAGINDGFGPLELDLVRVVLPTYGIDQVQRIVGIRREKGRAAVTYFLNDFPDEFLHHRAVHHRLSNSVDFMSSTYAKR